MQRVQKSESAAAGMSATQGAGVDLASARGRELRRLDFASGEASLAPAGAAPVQRKVEDVKGLDTLNTTKAGENGVVEGTANFNANTMAPESALPWTPTGWDAQKILTHLGQHDRLKGTDSDGRRCVQAVALASHILSGPEATASFLGALKSDALKVGPPSARTVAAMGVLEEVRGLIASKKATYGDLSWAQEAAHDMAYTDQVGTPEGGVKDAMVPPTDKNSMQTMSVWCSTPGEVLAAASALKDKQQLLVCTWSVTFNANLDAGEDEQEIGKKNDEGKTETKSVHRIDASKKPAASEVDAFRDEKHGHQLLVYKTGDKIWFYDPEITKTGDHLSEVGKDGKELASAFRDYPKFGIYGYVELLGKVTPGA